MKKILTIIGLSVLTGCYSVPERPDFSLDLAGNYKAVADCAWLEFRKRGGWKKDDLDSMKRVEFSFGNSESTAGRIDIQEASPGRTRVVSHMPQAVWGKDFWPNQHAPIFRACASS